MKLNREDSVVLEAKRSSYAPFLVDLIFDLGIGVSGQTIVSTEEPESFIGRKCSLLRTAEVNPKFYLEKFKDTDVEKLARIKNADLSVENDTLILRYTVELEDGDCADLTVSGDDVKNFIIGARINHFFQLNGTFCWVRTLGDIVRFLRFSSWERSNVK